MKAEVLIRALARGDERTGFRSGNVDLDRFFQRYAGQNQFRHHIGTTYVAVADDCIKGFVTLSPGELTAETVSQATRKRSLPTHARKAHICRCHRFPRSETKETARRALSAAIEQGEEAVRHEKRYVRKDGSPVWAQVVVSGIRDNQGGCATWWAPPSTSASGKAVEQELKYALDQVGREKGAYTGALRRQVGRFELADDGTLFLDEISVCGCYLSASTV